jgi:adenylate cyclase
MAILRPAKLQLRRRGWNTTSLIANFSYSVTLASALAVIVITSFIKSEFLPDLDNLIFDWYQRLDPRVWDPKTPVRIIAIDDESIRRYGQWPWPRSRVAELLERASALGAAVVAIDIVFAEPDGSSPEQVVTLLPPSLGRSQLEEEIKNRPPNDAMLAQALARTPAVLGTILTQDGRAADFPVKYGIAAAGDEPSPFLAHFSGAVLPLPILLSASAGLGALNWLPDRDQIVRRVPLLLALDEKIVPSLSTEAFRLFARSSTIVVRSSNASGQFAFGAGTGVNSIKIGTLEIPTDASGDLRVHYTPSEPRRFIPAWSVLAGELDRSEIEGRIIVLGITAVGLRDQRSTPLDVSVAGTEIQAQAIEQMFAGAWLKRPDWSSGAELVMALLLSLALGAALPSIGALTGAVAAMLAIALPVGLSRYEFVNHGLLLDPLVPTAAVSLVYVSCVVWLYRAEQRKRKFVRQAFARYVSPVIVERLAEDPAKLALGGETRILTVMFCDIRGFTSIAERMDAQSLTRFMNDYLTPMTGAVLAEGGTIDKYIGDAVMAFWNAPLEDADHATHAARAAQAMLQELSLFNESWRKRAVPNGGPHRDVSIGIGLSTGECCVGNLGSLQRFDYSVLGDTVNLAARLEAATKVYQTDILAAQATRDLSPTLPWLEVDEVRVRGKTQTTRIFTLAGNGMERASPGFALVAEKHDRMLAAYRSGEFAAAAEFAREVDKFAHSFRGLYRFYQRRFEDLERNCPREWNPIIDLSSV